jgi:hypothetical protein
LFQQPCGQVRVIGGALPADADILAGGVAGADRALEQDLDRRVALIEGACHQARVAIQAERQLGQVVGADGKAVEIFEEAFREYRVGRQFAHHDQTQAVSATFQAIFGEDFHHIARFLHGAHEGDHHLDVLQAHVLAHVSQRLALELEAGAEGSR